MNTPSEASLRISDFVKQITLVRHNFVGVAATEKQLDKLKPTDAISTLKGIEQLYIPFGERDEYNSSLYPGELGYCYEYAWRASLANPNLVYCEGYATNVSCRSIPLMHAWCVDKNTGLVIDSVWNDKASGVGYCGVPMQRSFVGDVLAQTKTFGVIENMHMLRKDYFDGQNMACIVHKDFLDVVFK